MGKVGGPWKHSLSNCEGCRSNMDNVSLVNGKTVAFKIDPVNVWMVMMVRVCIHMSGPAGGLQILLRAKLK